MQWKVSKIHNEASNFIGLFNESTEAGLPRRLSTSILCTNPPCPAPTAGLAALALTHIASQHTFLPVIN